MFFLVSCGFWLGNLPWMPFLHSLFLIVESRTLSLIEASEACCSLDVVLGSFMTSWMRSVASFLNLWIMILIIFS